ncbi:hypothetical protein WJX82_006982 [Trebouxia sp. C0006]
MTADGFLHSLALSDQFRHGSLLDGLATSSVNLRREVQKLGGPTTLALGTASKPDEASICIGGQTGCILVVPANCFETQSASGCHELHFTPSGYLGFFSKSTTPAVTWTASLEPFAPELFCALHSDCSLRFWNTTTQQRVLVENLLQQSGQKGHVTPTAVGSVCSAQGHLRLVVHLDPKADTGVPRQTVAVSMDLEQAGGQLLALNMRERMLEHSHIRFQSILTHASTADAEAILMEKQGVDTGSGQQKLQDGLWQSIQDRLLEQTGHSLQEDVLPNHFMQQLLAPGVLSQQALSHALLELEEPLARYNASMSEVQQHLTAAAQGIAAREKCSQLTGWRRVVQTYWRHWGELHRAVGLVELPHGTIAIVRSGHMQTLLQKADPLSVSQQGTSISADVSPAHAELFLPDFAAQCGGVSLGHEPHVAVSALASYFQAGCSHAAVPSSLTGSLVVQQVVAVGQKLIHLHQVAHMHHLLALAGEAADTPGAAFLRGYAGLHQAQNSTSAEQGKQAVQIAVGNLFQAMAVFHTANQPTQYGQQKDLTDSCNMIKHVIHDILVGLTGSSDRPGPQGEELQYLTALMMQSEHWGWPQAAASFAQAAMHQIEVVYIQDNAPESDADRADWTAQRQNQESMFCANLFVYALEGEQYQDAYTAVQANPVAHVALGTLQRLVNTLINTSNIATLCSLPYAADYTVRHSDGRFEILSLLQVTQDLLEQRAASADLNSQPQLYDVLYDFYCMRSNFKAAAAAQYTLACRLRDEAKHVPHCLHQRAAALLLSATALSLVEPSQRWLLNPAPLLQSLRAPQPFITPQTPSPYPSTAALLRCKAGIGHSIVVLTGDSSQALGSKCQYTDLTKEHAAAHAHALLAHLQPDAEQKPTVPDDVFQQALALGLFQVAFSLAVVVYQGRRLSLALQAAISAMATSSQDFDDDAELRPDFEDLSAAATWHAVLDSLRQHETSHHKHCLHLTAVRAALGKERRLKLPAALLAPFQAPPEGPLTGMAGRGPDPAALLSVYLQYDRLTDAADLVLSHLAAYQKADANSRQGHCKVWFPFRIIRNLMTQLGKNVSLQKTYSLLQAALQQHQYTAFSMSSAFHGGSSDELAVMEE